MPFFQRTYRLIPQLIHRSTNCQAPSLAPWGNLQAENRVQIYNYFVKRETL